MTQFLDEKTCIYISSRIGYEIENRYTLRISMYKFDYYANPRALIHRLEYYLCRNNEASINLTLVPLLSNKFYCESISILFAASDSCIDRQSAIFFFLFSSSNNEKKKKKILS